MSLFMLHTDIAADLIQGKSPTLDMRIASTVPQELCISAVTRAELLCGLSRQTLQKNPDVTPEEPAPQKMLRKSPRPKRAPIDQTSAESQRKSTHAALVALTPREATALRKRFGIDYIDISTGHTLEKIEKQFDFMRDRIRLQEWASEKFGKQLDSTTDRSQLQQSAHLSSRVLDQFLTRVRCLPWDETAATHFASVAVELHRLGIPIGSMDTMIAGHAIALGAVLVTNNEHHFARVPGLNIENWTRG